MNRSSMMLLVALAVGCSKKESAEQKAHDQSAPAPAPTPAPTPAPDNPAPPAGQANAVDACTLVSKAEVEAITKRKASDPTGAPSGGMSQCTFGDPESNAPLGLVKVVALNAGGPGPARSAYEVVTTDAKEKVEGVGEGASLKNDEYSTHLFVLKGAYSLEVTVNLADKSLKRDAAAEKAAAIEIAKKAAAKLP